jgi:hypothetical protein
MISKSYPPTQYVKGLFVRVFAKWGIPESLAQEVSLRRATPEETIGAAALATGLCEKGMYA